MHRLAPWSVAVLVITGAQLLSTSPTNAQNAPNTSSTAPTAPLSVTVPARGLEMDQVENRFGVPEAKLPAVGEPPITRWIYNGFTVYFEDRYVIHAVIHQ